MTSESEVYVLPASVGCRDVALFLLSSVFSLPKTPLKVMSGCGDHLELFKRSIPPLYLPPVQHPLCKHLLLS